MKYIYKNCFHCNKKILSQRKLCKKCYKLPYCEICNIIFCDIPEHIGCPSVENPKRCESCVFFEKFISGICNGCGNQIINSPEYYKLYGNYCWVCNAKFELLRLTNKIDEKNIDVEPPRQILYGEAEGFIEEEISGSSWILPY